MGFVGDALRVLAWVGGAVLAIAVYEVLRASVLRRVRLRLQRGMRTFLAENRPRLDRFKFIRKHYLREALLDDADLSAYVLRRAAEAPEGGGVAALRRRVLEYVEEIVPSFDLVSYYQLGQGLARPLVRALYDVPVGRRAATPPPAGGAVVYVANHRSNADYVLLSVVLARQVALSYAIGEWARVWPLESLFKRFGGYFVRRGEKDPLYHRVLRRYVQVIVREGVTQGIFLEGGLSRDGNFREPRAGLLDAIVSSLADPSFRGEISFVPVGLNYDRVLEDTRLLSEAGGRARAPTLGEKARSLARVLVEIPRSAASRALSIGRGAWRAAWGSRGTFGLAAVEIGPAVTLGELLGGDPSRVAALPEEARREETRRLAALLMERIAAVVPVTPVPLLCLALARVRGDGGDGVLAADAVRGEVASLLAELRRRGAPLALGPDLDAIDAERAALAGEADDRRSEILALEERIVDAAEVDALVESAARLLVRRGVLQEGPGGLRVGGGRWEVVRYYARSVAHHVGQRIPGPGAEARSARASHAPRPT
ncbi:1-acyl-sn-glycerol-3-phosphate acyltransferase [Myxococcota bacterium]|nr:1-acyl-sn-glycerol-3-phosphate acyltransferase [Myxococcota bacterium]